MTKLIFMGTTRLFSNSLKRTFDRWPLWNSSCCHPARPVLLAVKKLSKKPQSKQAAKEAGNMVDLDNDPTKLIEIVEIGKQLLMTRGTLTTFSIANDVAKYFAIVPALFMLSIPELAALNIMGLHSLRVLSYLQLYSMPSLFLFWFRWHWKEFNTNR